VEILVGAFRDYATLPKILVRVLFLLIATLPSLDAYPFRTLVRVQDVHFCRVGRRGFNA
jgi:hypothetical protein